MMVPNQAPKSLSALQAELRSIGLSIPKAMKTLPDWSDAALEHPSGVLEVQGFFARYFGLEVGRDGRLQRRKLPLAKFKTSKHTSPEAVEAARGFAFSVCKIVASAVRKPYGNLTIQNRAARMQDRALFLELPLQRKYPPRNVSAWSVLRHRRQQDDPSRWSAPRKPRQRRARADRHWPGCPS